MRTADRTCELSEAIASIGDGDAVALGGFLHYRHPMAAVREIVRQGRRHLRVIAPIGGIDADMLIAGDAAASVTFGFVSLEAVGLAPAFTRPPNPDLVYYDYGDQTIVRSLQATTLRVPWIPIRTWIGSQIDEFHPGWQIEIDGQSYWAAPAIDVDVAILHVPYATPEGQYLLWGEGFDGLLAKAADRLIITAERLVGTAELLEVARTHANGVSTGHYAASHVVHAPWGAHPTSCFPLYSDDLLHQLEYHDQVREGGWERYSDAWIGRDEEFYRQHVIGADGAGLERRMSLSVALGEALLASGFDGELS
ncbi:CoA transferase subunit A [Nocardia harenae]|uniref:CoA transferase subunit A n=1 Tax=Nocardia harenae TaxID=358707 RepID=UPI000835CED7|nr:CoA-transferase [Nocardia harenae]